MKANSLLRILIAIYIARLIMPVLTVMIPSFISVFMAVIILVFLMRGRGMNKMVGELLLLYFWSFLLYLVPKLTTWGFSLLPVYEFMNILFVPSIITCYLLSDKDEKTTMFLKNIALIAIFVTCITTIAGNNLLPGASRMMATGMADNPELLQSYYRYNIGGFDFVYTIVLLVPYMVYCIKTGKGIARLFYIVFLVAILYTVVMASYTTALLCSIIGMMTFFIPGNLSIRKVVQYMTVFVLLALLFKEILPLFFNWLAESIGEGEIATRLYDLSAAISGENLAEDSDISSRQELYTTEWHNFLSSPIWGTFKLFGGHSFLLGILSYYGIIGALMSFAFLKQLYGKFFEIFKN